MGLTPREMLRYERPGKYPSALVPSSSMRMSPSSLSLWLSLAKMLGKCSTFLRRVSSITSGELYTSSSLCHNTLRPEGGLCMYTVLIILACSDNDGPSHLHSRSSCSLTENFTSSVELKKDAFQAQKCSGLSSKSSIPELTNSRCIGYFPKSVAAIALYGLLPYIGN